MRYHYLNHDLNPSAQCYGLFDGDSIVGFCAVTHFPHPNNSKLKHYHRLVILPDYQGIGLGTKFLNAVASIYAEKGFDFSIVTSARNLMQSLKRNNNWFCSRYGELQFHKNKTLDRTSSHGRTTATFFWKGEK